MRDGMVDWIRCVEPEIQIFFDPPVSCREASLAMLDKIRQHERRQANPWIVLVGEEGNA